MGGQAVNLWADLYQHKDICLQASAPFTSRDCDLLGDRETLEELGRKTGWQIEYTPPRSPSPVVGYLTHSNEDGQLLFAEVLRTVFGLTRQECEKSVVPLERGGKRYRVMSPVSLLKAKITNAARLDQTERQDLKHVSIIIRCVHHFLTETHEAVLAEEIPPRPLINLLNRCHEILTSDDARQLVAEHQIDFSFCVPDVIQTSPVPAVQNFLRHRHPE